MKLLHKNIFLFFLFCFLFMQIICYVSFESSAASNKVGVTVSGETEIGSQISVKIRISSTEVVSSVAYTLVYEIPSSSGMTQGNIHENIVCEEKRKYYEKEYQFDAASSGVASFWIEECHINNDLNEVLTSEKKVCQIRSTLESNALLESLEIEGYSLEFSPQVQQYSLYVPYEVTQLVIWPKAQVDEAVVTIRGNENFQVGNNQIIIMVTSADATNTKRYLIEVVRVGQIVSTESEVAQTSWLFRIGESPLMWPVLMVVLAGTVVTVILVDLVILEKKKDTEEEGQTEISKKKKRSQESASLEENQEEEMDTLKMQGKEQQEKK